MKKVFVSASALVLAAVMVRGANLGIERVSFGQAIGANAAVEQVTVSGDGRYIAFTSSANNLVAGDTNFARDIFVYDRQTGVITRVSVATGGTQANGDSSAPSLSDDGRLVAFISAANNLVDGDTNSVDDAFVHDRDTGITTRVSVSSAGVQANGDSYDARISGNDRYVAFASFADNLVTDDLAGKMDVFRHDRQSGETIRVSKPKNEEADDHSGPRGNVIGGVSISRNGKFIAFLSDATNLVKNDTNNEVDVFVVDADHPQLKIDRVSVASGGGEGLLTITPPAVPNGSGFRPPPPGCCYCAISPDGLFVAFCSGFTNLVANDTNATFDVFLHQRDTNVTQRVSVSSAGVQGNLAAYYCSVSEEGRQVVFSSFASNLVDGDTNASADVFLRDVAKGTTRRISVSSSGTEGNDHSTYCAIANDGQVAAFISEATNLVVPDRNGVTDAFVHLVNGGLTSRVSELPGAEGNAGSGMPGLSEDGRRLVYQSLADNLVENDLGGHLDIFMLDRCSGDLRRVSVDPDTGLSNGQSQIPAISANGNVAIFTSFASNLVPDDTNGYMDAFAYDWNTDTVERVSVSSSEVQGNENSYAGAVSADGRYVAFLSAADNLVAGDTNNRNDIFVRDRVAGTTERVSVGDDEAEANDHSSTYCAISADGNLVAFVTFSNNLVPNDTNVKDDVFVRDRAAGTTERVSVGPFGEQANGVSGEPAMSADGRYVAFSSRATNLDGPGNDTNGCIDIFVRDRQAGITERMRTDDGWEPNGDAYFPVISADGRFVAYFSDATNLVPGDSNGKRDLFVCDRLTGRTRRLGENTFGAAANDDCPIPGRPALSGDGRLVAFAADATNLVDGDLNAATDVFLARDTGAAVTYGQTFQVNSGDVPSLEDNFTSKAKVTGAYVDPVKGLPKRKAAKVWTAGTPLAPADTLYCEWKGKVALFNKKLLPKTQSNAVFFAANPILPLDCDLLVSTTKADGTKLVDAATGAILIPPPEITGIFGGPGGIDGATDQVWPGRTVVLRGAFFGTKKPKVWLEYFSKGVLKALKLSVQSPYRFRDIKRVAGKSCMEVDTGVSEVTVVIPDSWPTGWDHGVEHHLVMDNGLGRAVWPLRTASAAP